jgi:hypothetical protein
VKEKINDMDILLKFNARDFPGPNYLLQDCTELEEKRLRPVEHLLMLKTLSTLTLTVKGNSMKVEENNEKLISTMNKNTAALIRAIEGIGKSGKSKKISDNNIIGIKISKINKITSHHVTVTIAFA